MTHSKSNLADGLSHTLSSLVNIYPDLKRREEMFVALGVHFKYSTANKTTLGTPLMVTHFYWEHILNATPAILARFHQIFLRLQQGERGGLHIEQLQNHRIFSVRVNRKHRLLFSTVPYDGRVYPVYLAYSDRHYEDLRFLRDRKNIKRFENTMQNAVDHMGVGVAINPLNSEHWKPVDASVLPDLSAPAQSGKAIPCYFYGDKMIIPSETQRDLLNVCPPALVTGLPGSGKTSTIVLAMPRLSTIYPRVLCLTTTLSVCNEMKTAFNEIPRNPGNADNTVAFMTWRQLADTDPSHTGKREVGEEDFALWFSQNAKKIARLMDYKLPETRDKAIRERVQALRQAAASTASEAEKRHALVQAATLTGEARRYYHEVRIASGRSREDYANLGERRSIFAPHSIERSFVYACYLGWKQALEHDHCLDLAVTSITLPASEIFDLVVLDEGQDASYQQLVNLRQIGKGNNAIVIVAPHQDIRDALSSMQSVKDILRAPGTTLTQCNLSGSWRMPLNSLPMADWIVKTTNKLSQGVSFPGEDTSCEEALQHTTETGAVYWRDQLSATGERLVCEATQHADFVIITHEHFKPDVRSRFGEHVAVMTCEEIKGMQFESVLLWRFLETPGFQKISQKLPDMDSVRESHNRPKHETEGEERRELHKLFVAISRHSNTLSVFQPTTTGIENLCNALKQCGPLQEGELTLLTTHHGISPEAWHERVVKHIELRNLTEAHRLFASKSLGDTDAFKALVSSILGEGPSVAASSVPEQAPVAVQQARDDKPLVAQTTQPASRKHKARRKMRASPSTAASSSSAPSTPAFFKPQPAQSRKQQPLMPLAARSTARAVPKRQLMTFSQLCMQQPGAYCMHSQLTRFCQPHDESQHLVFLAELQCNPALLKTCQMTLDAAIWKNEFKAEYVDFPSLINLSTTTSGQEVLKLLVKTMVHQGTLPPDQEGNTILIGKLIGYLGLVCKKVEERMHFTHSKNWMITTYSGAIGQIKTILSEHNEAGMALWNSVDPSLGFQEKLNHCLALSGAKTLIKVDSFHATMALVESLLDTIDRRSVAAGLLRVVRDEFDPSESLLFKLQISPLSQWKTIITESLSDPRIVMAVLKSDLQKMASHNTFVDRLWRAEVIKKLPLTLDSFSSQQAIHQTMDEVLACLADKLDNPAAIHTLRCNLTATSTEPLRRAQNKSELIESMMEKLAYLKVDVTTQAGAVVRHLFMLLSCVKHYDNPFHEWPNDVPKPGHSPCRRR